MLRFIISAFVGAFGKVFAAAVLLAMGIDPAHVLAAFASPPWWLLHPLTKLAFVLSAIIMLAWMFYEQSRVEIKIPDRLKRKKSVSFKEIAEQLSSVEHLGYSADEIMHRLMMAFWRGDFESANGESCVTLPISSTTRLTANGDIIPITEQPADEDDDNAMRDMNPHPENMPWNRRTLADYVADKIYQYYPSLSDATFIQRLQNDDIAWASLKLELNFDLLERIPPAAYTDTIRLAYLNKFTIGRNTFIKWFERLRNGRYDQNIPL